MSLRVPDVDDEQHRRSLCSARRWRRPFPSCTRCPASHPCAAVEAALELKGIAFQRVELLPLSQLIVGPLRYGGSTVPACASTASGWSARARSCAASMSSCPSPPLLPAARQSGLRARARGRALGRSRCSRTCRAACSTSPSCASRARCRATPPTPSCRCRSPRCALPLPLIARLMALQNGARRRPSRADLAALPGQLQRIDAWIARRPARRRAAERRRPADRQHDPAAAQRRRPARVDRRASRRRAGALLPARRSAKSRPAPLPRRHGSAPSHEHARRRRYSRRRLERRQLDQSEDAHPRSAVPRQARRPPVPRRLGAVRLARGRRGPRAGDVRARALAAAHAARRRRAVLPDARPAQHVPHRAGAPPVDGRSPSPRSRTSSPPTRSRSARPEQALEIQELYATIAELPEDFRMALVAIDVLGLSYREAARALRVREATITTRLFRARKQVAAKLADPEPDRSATSAPASRRSASGERGQASESPERARATAPGRKTRERSRLQQRRQMNEPHNPQTPAEPESDVVELIRSIDVRAPDSLHAKIDAMIAERSGRRRRAPRASRSSPPHARRRFGPRLAAVGSIVAAIAALVIVVALGSSSSTLSVHDAAALTLRAATRAGAGREPAPATASSPRRSTASPSPTGQTLRLARDRTAHRQGRRAHRSRPSSTRTRADVASAIRSSPAQSRRR